VCTTRGRCRLHDVCPSTGRVSNALVTEALRTFADIFKQIRSPLPGPAAAAGARNFSPGLTTSWIRKRSVVRRASPAPRERSSPQGQGCDEIATIVGIVQGFHGHHASRLRANVWSGVLLRPQFRRRSHRETLEPPSSIAGRRPGPPATGDRGAWIRPSRPNGRYATTGVHSRPVSQTKTTQAFFGDGLLILRYYDHSDGDDHRDPRRASACRREPR